MSNVKSFGIDPALNTEPCCSQGTSCSTECVTVNAPPATRVFDPEEQYRCQVLNKLQQLTESGCGCLVPITQCLTITVAGSWGSVGDTINEVKWFDTATGNPVESGSTYINTSTGQTVTGVDSSNAQPCFSDIAATVAVSNFPAVQTVDGTVAVTQSGTWAVRTQDGSGNPLTSHSPGSAQALDVAIVDGSGNQITSFGGGTQYAQGDVAATPTGTVAMWKDSGNVINPVSASTPLPVSSAQSGTWNINNVSGTVSLPTGASTSALQTTGNTTLSTISSTLTTINGKVPALGQALAASSVPVVLTAAQLSTLTPLSTVAISNFPATQNVNQTQINGVAVSTQIGTSDTGTQRVAIASDQTLSVNIQNVFTTVSVTGTVAATQSGTWNINNISGTISLPTGAATETTLAKLPLSQASTTSGQSGVLTQGAVTTSDPTYTTAQTSPLSLTTAGRLRVDATATIAANSSVNVNQYGGTNTTLGQKAMTASMPVVVASDQSLIPTGAAQGTTVTGTITTSSSAITSTVSGYSNATITVDGTYAGVNFGFFGSIDGGATYPYVLQAVRSDSQVVETTSGVLSNTSRMWNVPAVGITNIEVLASAYTSGTATIKIIPTADSLYPNPVVGGTVAATQSGTWNITNVSGTVSLPTGASTSALQTTGNTSLSSIDSKVPALGQALAAASVPVVLTAAQISTLTPLSTVAATQSGTWNITNISGTVSLPTGAATAAKQPTLGTAGSASTDVITVQGIASMTALKVDGSAVTQPISGSVSIAAATSGGWTPQAYYAQTTTVRTVKGSAGQLGGYIIYNPNASVAYVQIFNTTSTVTLGTTVPDMSIGIPGGATANVEFGVGIVFSTGIKLACTTTAQGLTAPGTGLDLNILYK